MAIAKLDSKEALLSKPQVCERLGLSARTLEAMVNDGQFPPPVRLGKRVYWCEPVVAAWLQRVFGPQLSWRP